MDGFRLLVGSMTLRKVGAVLGSVLVVGCSASVVDPPSRFATPLESLGHIGPSTTTFVGTVQVEFTDLNAEIVEVTPIVEGDGTATVLGWTDCSKFCAGMLTYDDATAERTATNSVTVTVPFVLREVVDDAGTLSAVLTLEPSDPADPTARCLTITGLRFHTRDGRVEDVIPSPGWELMAVGVNHTGSNPCWTSLGDAPPT